MRALRRVVHNPCSPNRLLLIVHPVYSFCSDERVGKPFGLCDRDEANYDPNQARPVGGVRGAVEVYQPRGVSDGTVAKPMYIETDDEPWHFTSKQSVSVSKTMLQQGEKNTLPFMAAEDALLDATRAAKDGNAAAEAIKTALAGGARPGGPAIKAAEAVVKGFEKSAEDGEKAKPKPPKAAANGKGWDEYGPGKRAAKTHDNSVA